MGIMNRKPVDPEPWRTEQNALTNKMNERNANATGWGGKSLPGGGWESNYGSTDPNGAQAYGPTNQFGGGEGYMQYSQLPVAAHDPNSKNPVGAWGQQEIPGVLRGGGSPAPVLRAQPPSPQPPAQKLAVPPGGRGVDPNQPTFNTRPPMFAGSPATKPQGPVGGNPAVSGLQQAGPPAPPVGGPGGMRPQVQRQPQQGMEPPPGPVQGLQAAAPGGLSGLKRPAGRMY